MSWVCDGEYRQVARGERFCIIRRRQMRRKCHAAVDEQLRVSMRDGVGCR